MTCTDFLSKLTDYFDGHISPDLLEEVREHSAACHHCEVVLDTTRKTIEVYRDNELYTLSSSSSSVCIPPSSNAARPVRPSRTKWNRAPYRQRNRWPANGASPHAS